MLFIDQSDLTLFIWKHIQWCPWHSPWITYVFQLNAQSVHKHVFPNAIYYMKYTFGLLSIKRFCAETSVRSLVCRTVIWSVYAFRCLLFSFSFHLVCSYCFLCAFHSFRFVIHWIFFFHAFSFFFFHYMQLVFSSAQYLCVYVYTIHATHICSSVLV